MKDKQDKLLDMKLEDVISDKTYLLKYNELENNIKDFLEQKDALKNEKFDEKTQRLLELS